MGWMKITRRNPDESGVPPVKDIYVGNLTSGKPGWDDPEHPAVSPLTDEHLVYNLGQSVASDFYDIQRHAVNYVADYPSKINPRLEALILQPLPYIRYGAYQIKISYVIPGTDKVSSSYDIDIFNRIPDNE